MRPDNLLEEADESLFDDDGQDTAWNNLGNPHAIDPAESVVEFKKPDTLPDTQTDLPETQAEEVLRKPPQELSIKWSESPSIIDQFMLRPETCKPGPIVTRVFDLCEVGDLASFNQIKEKAFPEGAPQIMIMREEIVPFDNSSTFKAILQYRPISYMVLQSF